MAYDPYSDPNLQYLRERGDQLTQQTQQDIGEFADPALAEAVTRDVQDNEKASYQLDQILQSDSPLMQRAKTQGMQTAASRGLLNSSIAAGESMNAMIDRATPIAQSDASAYVQAAMDNMGQLNETNRFNVGQQNQFGLQRIQNAFDANQNTLGYESDFLLQNADQSFRRIENEADRALQKALQGERLTFEEKQAIMDRDIAIAQMKSQENLALAQLRSADMNAANSLKLAQASLQANIATDAANRALSLQLSRESQAFDTWRIENQNLYNAQQAELDRQFQQGLIDAQTLSSLQASYVNSVTAILTDPNLDQAAKESAIANLANHLNVSRDMFNEIDNGVTGPQPTGTGTTIPDIEDTATTDPATTDTATTDTATTDTATTEPDNSGTWEYVGGAFVNTATGERRVGNAADLGLPEDTGRYYELDESGKIIDVTDTFNSYDPNSPDFAFPEYEAIPEYLL